MKRFRSMLSAGIAVVPLVLAGSGVEAQETEVRTPGEFDSIVVRGGIDVEVRQGQDFLVEVIARPEAADGIVTEVNGTTLEISVGERSSSFFGLFDWFSPDPVVAVTLPMLKSISAQGGADIVSADGIAAEELSVSASGGSDIHMHVNVTSLQLNLSSGSDIELFGTAGSATLRSSGGSDVNAMELTAREVNVASSGGSDSIFLVEDRIAGNASGGSAIAYLGNPDIVEINTSGGAEVIGL